MSKLKLAFISLALSFAVTTSFADGRVQIVNAQNSKNIIIKIFDGVTGVACYQENIEASNALFIEESMLRTGACAKEPLKVVQITMLSGTDTKVCTWNVGEAMWGGIGLQVDQKTGNIQILQKQGVFCN